MNTEKLKFSNLSTEDFEWLKQSYLMADSFNLSGYSSILSEKVTFQMGNSPVASNKEEILKNVSNFWASIHSMNHNFINAFSVDNTIILEAHIDYEKQDGRKVTLPCVTIIERDEKGLATSNRVFIDMNALFQ